MLLKNRQPNIYRSANVRLCISGRHNIHPRVYVYVYAFFSSVDRPLNTLLLAVGYVEDAMIQPAGYVEGQESGYIALAYPFDEEGNYNFYCAVSLIPKLRSLQWGGLWRRYTGTTATQLYKSVYIQTKPATTH